MAATSQSTFISQNFGVIDTPEKLQKLIQFEQTMHDWINNYGKLYFDRGLVREIFDSSKWNSISLERLNQAFSRPYTRQLKKFLDTLERNRTYDDQDELSILEKSLQKFLLMNLAEIQHMFQQWLEKHADEMLGMELGWNIEDQLKAGAYTSLLIRMYLANPLNVRNIEEHYNLPLTGDPTKLMNNWNKRNYGRLCRAYNSAFDCGKMALNQEDREGISQFLEELILPADDSILSRILGTSLKHGWVDIFEKTLAYIKSSDDIMEKLTPYLESTLVAALLNNLEIADLLIKYGVPIDRFVMYDFLTLLSNKRTESTEEAIQNQLDIVLQRYNITPEYLFNILSARRGYNIQNEFNLVKPRLYLEQIHELERQIEMANRPAPLMGWIDTI